MKHVAVLVAFLFAAAAFNVWFEMATRNPTKKIMDRIEAPHDRVRWPVLPCVTPEQAEHTG